MKDIRVTFTLNDRYVVSRKTVNERFQATISITKTKIIVAPVMVGRLRKGVSLFENIWTIFFSLKVMACNELKWEEYNGQRQRCSFQQQKR